MRIAHRAAALALSALVVGLLSSAVAASAGTNEIDTPGRTSTAAAAARSLDLELFGSSARIGSASAQIDARPAARATAAGVVSKAGNTTAKVDAPVKRQAAKECSPGTAMFELLDVDMACGEARVQTLPPLFTADVPRHTGAALLAQPPPRASGAVALTDNGGPQAIGRGSVGGVNLGNARLLQPAIAPLQSLLDAMMPVLDETVAAVTKVVSPSLGQVLRSLADDLRIRPGDPVRPLATLLEQLLDRAATARGLASIELADSVATTNTTAESVVAFAVAGGGRVDVLPSATPGGPPLLSVIVDPMTSTSTFDRATDVRTPTFEPAVARVQLGVPLVGGETTELRVLPGAPLTLLAGTPLETTISVGAGQKVDDTAGVVSTSVDGVSVHLFKGVRHDGKSGIHLRLGHAESRVGGEADSFGGGRVGWPPIVAATLLLLGSMLLLAYTSRRRVTE